MQQSQRQADQSFALKDAYVEGGKGAVKEGRLIPGIAQQPAVLQASGHMFLDEGKEGGINDNDPTLYIHGGGETYKFNKPGLRNPVPGGVPGQKKLEDSDPQELDNLRRQYDEYRQQKENERYGTGNLAEFSDQMTIKSVIG